MSTNPPTSTRTPKRPSGWTYEALCRYAISREYNATPQFIYTGKLPGASRTGQRVRHQIDLYWKTENALCTFLTFANAKQHRARKADLRDIMILLSVMHEISAHKGMLITNTGFTSGVIQIAADRQIALLIIKPLVSLDDLPTTTVAEVSNELESRAAQQSTPVYQLQIIQKSWFPTPPACPPQPQTANPKSQMIDSPQPPPASLPEPDLSYLIASQHDDFPNSIDNKSMTPHALPNKMIHPTPAPNPPSNRPFGLRTK